MKYVADISRISIICFVKSCFNQSKFSAEEVITLKHTALNLKYLFDCFM